MAHQPITASPFRLHIAKSEERTKYWGKVGAFAFRLSDATGAELAYGESSEPVILDGRNDTLFAAIEQAAPHFPQGCCVVVVTNAEHVSGRMNQTAADRNAAHYLKSDRKGGELGGAPQLRRLDAVLLEKGIQTEGILLKKAGDGRDHQIHAGLSTRAREILESFYAPPEEPY